MVPGWGQSCIPVSPEGGPQPSHHLVTGLRGPGGRSHQAGLSSVGLSAPPPPGKTGVLARRLLRPPFPDLCLPCRLEQPKAASQRTRHWAAQTLLWGKSVRGEPGEPSCQDCSPSQRPGHRGPQLRTSHTDTTNGRRVVPLQMPPSSTPADSQPRSLGLA